MTGKFQEIPPRNVEIIWNMTFQEQSMWRQFTIRRLKIGHQNGWFTLLNYRFHIKIWKNFQSFRWKITTIGKKGCKDVTFQYNYSMLCYNFVTFYF